MAEERYPEIAEPELLQGPTFPSELHLFDFALVLWRDLTLKDKKMIPEADQSPTGGQVKSRHGGKV